MTISDETLMAFADGELDEAARAAVEAALRDDPELERRVAQHRALRSRVHLAYAAQLQEAVPERLLAAARRPRTRFRWQPGLAMAASVLVGVGAAYVVERHARGDIETDARGRWVARGELAKALTEQVGGDPEPSAPVKVGLSFLAKTGDYCRTFTLAGAASRGGLACQREGEWRIDVLAQSAEELGEAPSGAFRQANSALSPLVLDAVQQQIVGEALDQSAEITARRQRWRPALQ